MGVKPDSSISYSPTEQFKLDLLKLLNKIELLDMEMNKKGYINGVKHLYWKMVKYTPRTVRGFIKKILEEMDEEKEKIKDLNLTSEQKEKKYLDVEYKFYNIICENITKVISFSPIVEEEITGILDTGDSIESLSKLNTIIKEESKKNIEVMDMGEAEEGVENIGLQ